ncbi:MAG TPA: carboxypeptidase-like regulatory domain-containing protein, partial [Bacteroidaceae bacterium]|nr:carboxypeptidase-like regulatory domain-containing protein [Bacteroidaceae bacterium]
MILKRSSYIILLSLFVLQGLAAQGIRGSTVDSNGDPVPYTAIFIRELSRGTTCNILGMFSLPLPPGEYRVFFRSLGYTEVQKTIRI